MNPVRCCSHEPRAVGFSLLGTEAALCTAIQKFLGSRKLVFCLSPGIFLLCQRGDLTLCTSLPTWESDLAMGVNKGFCIRVC